MHNLQGPLQNENVQKLLRISRQLEQDSKLSIQIGYKWSGVDIIESF